MVPRVSSYASIAPHPLLGHLPAFRRDPLAFLTNCSLSDQSAIPLRLLHIPAVLLLDPADIERVLVTEQTEFVKPAWLRTAAVRRLLGDGLVTSDGAAWRRLRHACQPAFHPRRVDGYAEAICGVARRALGGWRAGETRDLQREMSLLTLEVVARTLLEAEAPGWTPPAADAMDTLMARFASRSGLYGMAPLPPSPSELAAARTLDRIADRLIEHGAREHRAGDAPSCLLEMLRCPACDGGEGLSGRALRDQVKTFLGAGYESSALTLTWAFLMLAQQPEADARLFAEVCAAEPLTSDAALADLPYTQAVVKETLRLFPPLWMTGRQAVRKCEIGGVSVPAGALVMTSQWAVQRSARHFTCREQFRPDRWLSGETDLLPRFAFFPFGGGPRICIGQGFAMLESVLLLASIVRRFRLEPLPGAPVGPWPTMTLRPSRAITVRLVERERG
jgi:cytochrome P450